MMINEMEGTRGKLTANFLRNQNNYLTRFEDEVEETILEELSKDVRATSTVISVRIEFLAVAVAMLQDVYKYKILIDPETDTSYQTTRHTYVECTISW